MTAVVLPSPTGYVVWCETCPSEREYPSEFAAERAAVKHDESDAAAAQTDAHLRHAAARPDREDPHRHSFRCSQDVCGAVLYFCGEVCCVIPNGGVPCTGHPVKTRAEMIAKSSARHQKR